MVAGLPASCGDAYGCLGLLTAGREVACTWQICSLKARTALSVVRAWCDDVGLQSIYVKRTPTVHVHSVVSGGLLVVALVSIAEYGVPLACLR
jgi:hypothetical protein